jgi:3-keto-L-gulonate-6-phosphate decarboxylase
MLAVAGGDTIQDVQRAIFNDVDIVILWRAFYKKSDETVKLVQEFLKEIR